MMGEDKGTQARLGLHRTGARGLRGDAHRRGLHGGRPADRGARDARSHARGPLHGGAGQAVATSSDR